MRERLLRVLREEGGFTLPEMLVTTVIMLVVMFALYNIFDMSIRVFTLGNDKAEAVENARLGLEKMEREIRAAYPVDRSDPAKGYLFFSARGAASDPPQAMPSAAEITFGNELGAGDGRITCGRPCEYITYKLVSTANSSRACSVANAPCTLSRVDTNNAANSGDAVVEFVQPGGLTFAYFESDGTAPESESEISRVLVRLQVDVDGRTQSLTTNINLRNRTEAGS